MPTNDWEKEFDEGFKIEERYMPHVPVYWVKDFIREQLTLARREERESAIAQIKQKYLQSDGPKNRVMIAKYNAGLDKAIITIEDMSPTSITHNEETG